jgi:hypothetical protein
MGVAPSLHRLNDLEQLIEPITVFTGVQDELPRSLEDSALWRSPGHSDAATAPKLKQALAS